MFTKFCLHFFKFAQYWITYLTGTPITNCRKTDPVQESRGQTSKRMFAI